MYISQEVTLDPSGYENTRGGSQMYAIRQLPGMVARNEVAMQLYAEMPYVDEDLAEALFRLSEDYGIDFPGIGCLVKKDGEGAANTGQVYTTGHVVDGFNMHKDMAQIPLGVTIETLEKMLTYYENMSQDASARLYLADLSLRQ